MPKVYLNAEARRYFLRSRVIALDSYELAAQEQGVTENVIRRWAGPGLTRMVRGTGARKAK